MGERLHPESYSVFRERLDFLVSGMSWVSDTYSLVSVWWATSFGERYQKMGERFAFGERWLSGADQALKKKLSLTKKLSLIEIVLAGAHQKSSRPHKRVAHQKSVAQLKSLSLS